MIGVIKLSFTVKILNKEIHLDKPTRVYELFDNKDYKYLACTVNDVLAELDYLLTCDCEITKTAIGTRIIIKLTAASVPVRAAPAVAIWLSA